MLQTIVSLRAHLAALLKINETSIGLLRGGSMLPRIVIMPLDSTSERTSGENIDHDIMEIHCVASTPEDAIAMMDAVVNNMRELKPNGMPIRGGVLTGCEQQGGRSCSDQGDEVDQFDAVSVWRLDVEFPRRI